MPELIEIETYRQQANALVGRTVAAMTRVDDLNRRDDIPLAAFDAAVRGRTITGTRRVGKLLLLDTDGPTIGLRFGMTGRLLIDGAASIDELEYGSTRDEPAWDRFVMTFSDGGDLRLRDPRRLGGMSLDPDESRLGPDAASVSTRDLRDALGASAVALKARLLDQRHVAGLGNLLVDETLWRVGLAPTRPAKTVGDVAALARGIRSTVAQLTRRGGSHTGDLQPARQPGAVCPRDGAPLRREPVGGRTTYWCPSHQE